MRDVKPMPCDVKGQYNEFRNTLLEILADANDWRTITNVWIALEALKGSYLDEISNKTQNCAAPSSR